MIKFLLDAPRRFAVSCRGSVTVEAVFAFPILALAYLGFFAAFDAYRIDNLNERAAFTITDLLSRETNAVDEAYITNMNGLFRIVTQSHGGARVRVSVVRYDPDESDYMLVWSHATDGREVLTDATLDTIVPRMPPLAASDNAIVVETWTPFTPLFGIGLQPRTVYKMVVSRPRFGPQLVWGGA